MNNIFVQGRLTRDPEVRQTADGKPVVSFSVADNAPGKDAKVYFWNAVTFGTTATFVSTYMKKGALVNVVGSLTQSEYTAKDGTKKSATQIQADKVSLVQVAKPK